MKGGLESQGSFGGRLPGPWPQEGRVASDTHWPHVRTPDLLGSQRTLPSFKTKRVSHLFLGTETGALCVCVRVRE